ncbi:ribonuclease Y [Bacillota bacterium Meth-B3]
MQPGDRFPSNYCKKGGTCSLNVFVAIILALVALAVGAAAGFLYRQNIMEKKIGRTEEFAKNLYDEATRRAEEQKKEKLLEAKEEIIRLKSELDKEVKDRRNEVTRLERRVSQREETLDKKLDNLEVREEHLNQKYKDAERLEAEAQQLHDQQQSELERISNMTLEEARQLLIGRIQKDAYHDAAVMVREIEAKAKEEADKKARNLIALAIQKCAADHVAETTVSVVALPNDDMKGRIIGREGRNIRTLETATGVDLIIDDTPEAVIISGFDPVRREVARIALEKLIADGRIHPARIEEMVEKARRDVDNQIREAGEQAIFETNLHSIHHELVRLLGRMKYRTSYGQNVLKHSIEVSHLAGVMAAELGADVQLAKRAGLLHDIGKAIDHEVEGTHVTIGADLARKFHESEAVINAIMAHHNDVEPQTVEAVLVQAADAISAARPGARRESLENYIKRLQKLEEIANSFDGVEKSFAIQSGREVRIIVKPEDVNDIGTLILAKEVVKRIEREMEYPGQIKVNVIRETRAIDFAK